MIQQLITFAVSELERSVFAFVGGTIFFLSWMWQVYISRKKGQSKVDVWFWVIRFSGMSFVTIHVIMIKEWVLVAMNITGMLIYFYNIYLFWKNNQKEVI